MEFSAVGNFLERFETGRVVTLLRDLNVGELIHNPWFLGTMASLALLSLLMHYRILLVTILSVTGFAWLISYTMQRGTELESLNNQTLLVFVGGGVALIVVVIYLLFIRAD